MTITLTCEKCIIDEINERIVFTGVKLALEINSIKRWWKRLKWRWAFVPVVG